MEPSTKDNVPGILLGYETDAIGLGAIAESGALIKNIARFMNNGSTGNKPLKPLVTPALQRRIKSGKGTFRASDRNPVFHQILLSAHIAACCELFNGWPLQVTKITRQDMRSLAINTISSNLRHGHYSPGQLLEKLHRSDAIRTMQILREFGLLQINSNNTRQLSLACGPGTKDMESVHSYPSVKCTRSPNGEETITLSLDLKSPCNTVLVDNDPDLAEWYDKLNQTKPDNILAMNVGFDEAVAKLPALQKENGFGPRNFIVGLRIDHRMIPDIPSFFQQLSKIIDHHADFVVTVGSGYTLDEFRGRIKVLDNIYSWLRGQGMQPARFRLYDGKTLEEYRKNPSFGIRAIATYDILYCRLNRAANG